MSDLNIALYGLHGDAPHLVVAPSSLADCAFATQWAVHLADTLQTAAIMLSDQSLGQSRTIAAPADPGLRDPPDARAQGGRTLPPLRNTASGVSPMAVPGMRATGFRRRPQAQRVRHPSSGAADHSARLDKRLHKLALHDYGTHWADIEGDGDIAVLTWGSTTGPVREALERFRASGRRARLGVDPPDRRCAGTARCRAAGVARVLVVEQATMAPSSHRYLRAHYDLPGACAPNFHQPGRCRSVRTEIFPPTGRLEPNMEATSTCPSYSARDYKSEVKPVWCPGLRRLLGARARSPRPSPSCRSRPAASPSFPASAAPRACPPTPTCSASMACMAAPLPIATGIKVSRPELTVIASGGDGDGFLDRRQPLHAPAGRRNVDMTYIVAGQQGFGMTKGQASPTTAPDWENKLTPRHRHQPLPSAGDRAPRAQNFIAAASPATRTAPRLITAGDPPSRLLLRATARPASPSVPSSATGRTWCIPRRVDPTDDPRAPRAA